MRFLLRPLPLEQRLHVQAKCFAGYLQRSDGAHLARWPRALAPHLNACDLGRLPSESVHLRTRYPTPSALLLLLLVESRSVTNSRDTTQPR